MLYNPLNKTLWDDEGQPLKRLSCLRGATADDLHEGACRLCDREVFQLNLVSEEEVLARLRAEPDICVSFQVNDPRIKIIAHDPI